MRAPMKSLTQNLNPGPRQLRRTLASIHATIGALSPRGFELLMR